MKRPNFAVSALVGVMLASVVQAQLPAEETAPIAAVDAVATEVADPVQAPDVQAAEPAAEAPAAQRQIKPINAGPVAGAEGAEQFNDKFLELQRKLDIIKLEADIAEQQRRIDDANKPDAGKSGIPGLPGFPAGLSGLPPMGQGYPSAPADLAQPPVKKPAAKKAASIDDLYVTSIVGFGSNLTATVYYQNHILNVKQGAEVLPGIVAEEVSSDGAVFRQGKKRVRVPLTTGDIAYRKSFEQPEPVVKTPDPYAAPAMPFGMQ